MGVGVAASMLLGPGGKAGKVARAEAEAGAGLRGEARAGGRAAASADREPKGPYINNNPRATANERAVGANQVGGPTGVPSRWGVSDES